MNLANDEDHGDCGCRLAVMRSVVLAATCLIASASAWPQELNISPTRPTIANSAAVQSAGVVQVEVGYDAYPQRVPGNQQTVDTLIGYTPWSRLRLDFGWSAFNHQQDDQATTNGVGTIQIGGKVELLKEQYQQRPPGIALQYEAELPTASTSALQGYGQQIIFLLNHHYGKAGDVDVILNGSLVQSDCQSRTGCVYSGQQSFATSYHLQKETRLYAEVFSQNNSQSNTPPGTYVFAGFYHQFGEAFGIDGGMRFGVSNHSGQRRYNGWSGVRKTASGKSAGEADPLRSFLGAERKPGHCARLRLPNIRSSATS